MTESNDWPPVRRVFMAVVGAILALMIGTSLIMAGHASIGIGIVVVSLLAMLSIGIWIRRTISSDSDRER